jgi:hypothetical protein
MALEDLNIVENYLALKILRQVHLNAAMQSIEDFINTNVKLNLQQVGVDVFGPSYEYNNDGIQTLATPLADLVAKLDDNETITGSWVFDDTVSFNQLAIFFNIVTSSYQPRVKAYRVTSNQSVPSATPTAIAFAAQEYFTALQLHNTGSNNTRILIPSGGNGIYNFVGQATFAASATGRREVLIYKNGAEIAKNQADTASGSFDSTLQVTLQDNCIAGDYYELFVLQTSGGGLDVVFGANKTFFQAMKVW